MEAHPAGRVAGKIAIVTGSGGAIGRTIAHVLADEGAKVVVCDMSVAGGQQTTQEIEAKHGKGRVFFHQLDVSNEAEVEKFIKVVVDKWGGVDVLVNNAAVFVFGTVEDVSSEAWDQALSVNVKGYAFLAKHVVPIMKEKKRGSIINVGSISSFIAQPAFVPYNTTKGAILQLTRCLAMDCGSWNIRVNCVCPGTIETPATHLHANKLGISMQELTEQSIKTHFIKRLGTTDDVAKCVLFLASDESTFITGAAIPVDGGYTAQ